MFADVMKATITIVTASTQWVYLEFQVSIMTFHHCHRLWWTPQGVLQISLLYHSNTPFPDWSTEQTACCHQGMLCHESSTGKSFSFRVESPSDIHIYVLWCLFLISGPVWLQLYQWGLIHLGLLHHNPLVHTHSRYMCLLVLDQGPHQQCTKEQCFLCSKWESTSCYSNGCSPTYLAI